MFFIFVWRGRGYLVLLAAISAFVLTAVVASALGFRDATLPTYLIEIAATAAAFVPIWIYGNKWNSMERVLIDKATGEEFTVRGRHSAFGIPMQYWALIWPAVITAILGYAIFKPLLDR
jgi:hypothetical protein